MKDCADCAHKVELMPHENFWACKLNCTEIAGAIWARPLNPDYPSFCNLRRKREDDPCGPEGKLWQSIFANESN